MKIKKFPQLLRLLLFVPIVIGCRQSVTIAPSTYNKTPTPAITSVSQTASITITLASNPTKTQTPSSSPTVIPTLSTEDARKRLLELLSKNGNCKLPCLWNITPGKSNYQEAQNALKPLSSVAETLYFDQPKVNGILMGSITPLYVEGDLRLNIRIAYWYDDIGTVDFIFFRAIEELVKTDTNGNWISKQPIFDFPNYYKRVEYYSLSHVLSEQGMPSSVVIKASGAPGGPMIAAGIDIALLYPDQGIWVNYTMPMYNLDGVKKGCPANAHIEMELFPPGNPDFFFTQLDQTDWGVIKNGYIPLEEATSMSVEQFYHKFLNSNDNCIETPAYIWPTPEPRSDWP